MPRRLEWLGVALILAVIAAETGVALRLDASVADEHPHILSGWLYWTSGRFAGGLDNPPLGQLVVAAPLRLLGREYRYPDDAALVPCRIPVVLLTLGLGLVLWRWGRALGGTRTGLFALAGLALEPNLLAHGHLATLDAQVTAWWWLALWSWRNALTATTARTAQSAAACFALSAAAASLTKFNGALVVPFAWLATAFVQRDRRTMARATRVALVAVVATGVIAALLYAGAPHRGLLPEPLVVALQGKWAHREEVRFAYLLGRRSEHGFLAYYLVALLVKSPLSLLALAAWGLVAWRTRAAIDRSRPMPRPVPALDRALVLVPALGTIAAFTMVRVNVGVRHVLPVLPALVLLAALGASDLLRRGRTAVAITAALAIGWVADLARIAPQYLAYFNILSAGPAGGDRWLLDSNLSWGQDDRRLQAFLAAHAAEGWVVDPPPLAPCTGRFAVEANALHHLQRRSDLEYEWLRVLQPAGFAGWSWRLYDVDLAAFERAARDHPGSVPAAVGYAEALRSAGLVTVADSVLSVAARHDRHATATRVARYGLERGDWRRAAVWIESDVQGSENEMLRPWCAALAAVATAPDSNQLARAKVTLGIWHAERNELDAALPLLLDAVRIAPHDADALRTAAVAMARAGRYAEAVELLQRPAARDSFQAERELCRQMAVVSTDLAHGVTPDRDALFEWGRTAFEANRYDAAAAAFVALLQADPAHRLALAYLGEMQVRCKMRIVDQVLAPRGLRVAQP